MKNPVHYSLIYDKSDEISVMFPSNFKEEYGFSLTLNAVSYTHLTLPTTPYV